MAHSRKAGVANSLATEIDTGAELITPAVIVDRDDSGANRKIELEALNTVVWRLVSKGNGEKGDGVREALVSGPEAGELADAVYAMILASCSSEAKSGNWLLVD